MGLIPERSRAPGREDGGPSAGLACGRRAPRVLAHVMLDLVGRQEHKWDPVCAFPYGVVRPVRADGAQGPTQRQARGRWWRRTTPGFYVPVDVDPSLPEQRIMEKSMLLPAGGAVTGWASLRYHGGGFFDGLMSDGRTERPVPLAAGRGQHRRSREGVRWLQHSLRPEEVCVRHGVPCTTVERAVLDEIRLWYDVRQATVALDMAVAAGLTSLARVERFVDAHPHRDGLPLAREALGLADEGSRSPRETELRLVWVLDAALPPPLCNQKVYDIRTGRLLGVADLLDPEAGVVGEFDGGEHAGAGRRSRDAARDGAFRDHGLEVFRVTAVDLRDPAKVVARALAAYRRAARRTLTPTWTLEPPPDRARPLSVDEVLAERDLLREQHERWLRDGDPDIATIRGY